MIQEILTLTWTDYYYCSEDPKNEYQYSFSLASKNDPEYRIKECPNNNKGKYVGFILEKLTDEGEWLEIGRNNSSASKLQDIAFDDCNRYARYTIIDDAMRIRYE